MPEKDNMHGIDLEEKIKQMLVERIRQDMDRSIIEATGPPNEFILPKSVEYDRLRNIARKKFKDEIMQEWKVLKEQDPNEQFRKQTTKDIAEIKEAIRKIGIMFGGDAPSKEMMKKHKMLKDAYNKYKMLEALVLGQDK